MAFQLDTNIPLLARSGDPVAAANQAVQFGSMLDQLRTTREQAPIRQQLLQQQQEAGQLANQRQQQAIQAADQDRVLTSVAQGAQEILPSINSGDFTGAVDKLKARREKLVSEGVTDLSDTDVAIQALESGDAQQIQRIKTDANTAINIAQTRGLLNVAGGVAERFSPTTENLPGGITVQTTSTGKKRVTDAGGTVLKGEDAVNAINDAEELKSQRQIDVAGGRREAVLKQDIALGGEAAGTKKAAEAAIKVSTDAFTRLEPLRTNIVNIDDAINLIDEGAKTGVISSKLPSIRSASIKLDTLQKKLGLDVIASTTFGALSEGEREFALSTALPKTLKGPDLKEWLIEKKRVQEKLINQLSEAATFLGTPGNTIADFIEIKKLESQSQAGTAEISQLSDDDLLSF